MVSIGPRGIMAVLLGVSLLAGAGAAVAQDAQTKALLEKYRADFNAAKKGDYQRGHEAQRCGRAEVLADLSGVRVEAQRLQR